MHHIIYNNENEMTQILLMMSRKYKIILRYTTAMFNKYQNHYLINYWINETMQSLYIFFRKM